MKRVLFYLLGIFYLTGGYAYFSSVTLINDTPFELTAIIQAATGVHLGQVTIQPGEQSQWTSDLAPTDFDVPGQSSFSLTPYTVIWKCSHGGAYSVCSSISPGSDVRASSCPGMHYCESPQPEKKKQS